MITLWVQPENPHRTAVLSAVALECLHRARLAGAVRAEQCDHLAGMPDKGEMVDRDVLSP